MTMFTSPRRAQARPQHNGRSIPEDEEDLEAAKHAADGTDTNLPAARSFSAAVHPSAADQPPAGDTTVADKGNGNSDAEIAAAWSHAPPRRNSSSWSGRELVGRAEAMDRVKVTPAWSLNAALGAMSMSSSSSPASVRAPSAAATIVQQVAAAQFTGLVICGCAGSGQPAMSAALSAPGQRANGGVGGGSAGRGASPAPLSGANSVHGKWPSLGPLGRSRHGPSSLSLMTRSWHGKSWHYGRSHHSREAAAARAAGRAGDGGGGGAGGHPASLRPSSLRGGLASAVDGVIQNALEDLVGDVVGGLVRSERAPAVLAVRASVSVRSATV